MNKQYETLRVNELLNELGKGEGMSGSGGAAALSALMGAELLVSVCRITLQKEQYVEVHEEIRDVLRSLTEVHAPMLKTLMQQDVDAVRTLVKENEITDELITTPIAIGTRCFDVLQLGLVLFDKGYKVMKADVAVALSLNLSVAQSSVFITKENLAVCSNRQKSDFEQQLKGLQQQYAKAVTEVNLRLSENSDGYK